MKIKALAASALAATLVLSGCGMTNLQQQEQDPAFKAATLQDAVEVIKSPQDHRDYRYITLNNGVQVLLISDPRTDKAAAAVDVNTGSFNDPEDRLGLAHFLEHMLFLGNKKYPEVDGYFEYIRANGGSANAYTSSLRTNYFFDINSGQLQPALDQLAQFFVSPTLDKTYVDRERNAVDSEYKLHAKNDNWRFNLALNNTVNPEHPGSRFNIGNLETLDNSDGDVLWQDLVEFYKKYYVGPNISVVVYGKENMGTLEQWAREAFQDVPAGTKANQKIGIPLYTKEQLGVRINLIPLKEKRELTLDFPMPSVMHYYELKPLKYLGRLIGYEGKGSLHSLLKQKGWINSLSAGSHDQPNEYSEFSISMDLTPTGLEHVDEITALVFDYIALIKKQGVTRQLFDQSRQIASTAFRFREPGDPQRTVSGLAGRMHYYPPEHLLDSDFLWTRFDKKLIESHLDQMTPENLRQIVIAPGLETAREEQWFGTQYSIQPLSSDLMSRLHKPQVHSTLTIPAINPFIATSLDIKQSATTEFPEILTDQNGLKVWFKHDDTFRVPRADVRVRFTREGATATPQDMILLSLYRSLLDRSLNEYGYPAREAGLNYSIGYDSSGLSISLSGYNDKQGELLAAIIKAIKEFRVNPAQFQQEKNKTLKNLNNRKFSPPYRQVMARMQQTLFDRSYTEPTLIAAAESVTVEQLQQYAATFFQGVNIEAFFHGNLLPEDVNRMTATITKGLDWTPAPRYDDHITLLGLLPKQMMQQEMAVDHDDSVLMRYYQSNKKDLQTRARYALLGKMLGTPFFNQLRTEQQLGYVAFASNYLIDNQPGLVFMIQSPVLGPDGLGKRVDEFVLKQRKAVVDLTKAELDEYKQGLIGSLLKKDANLGERSARLWGDVLDTEHDFRLRQELSEAINKVSAAELLEAYDQVLMSDVDKPLTIVSTGKAHQQTAEK
ncbi:insulinase family protein [Spongorhabdus nitratireducens]